GEVTPGLASVGQAALDHTGRPVAGIAVTFRAEDVDDEARARIAALVGRAAGDLGRRLGAR
ncbi:MAG TPA: IclR family transcriptional regulator, partial [Actinotalea sp.]